LEIPVWLVDESCMFNLLEAFGTEDGSPEVQ
jgi:hypothetical protein